MARGINRLSALECGRLAVKPGKHHDGGGLYLDVRETRSKTLGDPNPSSWLLRYMADGKARSMGLGPYPALTLADARAKAAEARRTRALGDDPLDVRKAGKEAARVDAAKAMTFRMAAERYIASHKAGWKHPKHAAQWGSTLATYAYPLIGNLAVQAIETSHVANVLEQALEGASLWEARPETASRLRGRVEAILDWARVRGYRTGENPARWRGHLDQVLPARSKVRAVKHHDAISIDGIPDFMVALRAQEGTAARALEFAILTASRTGEVIGATWSEFDLAAKVWNVPAARMKAGRVHRVPLCDRVIDLLDGLRLADGADGSAYVFPGGKAGRPLSNMALLMLLRRMGRDDLTAHGFRSTFRDWVSECTSYPSEAAEMALAHAVGDKVEAAYRRGDLLERRKAMMAAWAAYCTQPAGVTVTPMLKAVAA